MIAKLINLLPEIHKELRNDNWDSLVINKRKPYTYRAFKYFGKDRVCIHRFDPCEDHEAFMHPHAWPAAFLVLGGEYIHTIGYTENLHDNTPLVRYREIVQPNMMYEIISPHTWHKVQPTDETWTIMINEEPWLCPHENVRTTKGKDLEKMHEGLLLSHLDHMERLLYLYLQRRKLDK